MKELRKFGITLGVVLAIWGFIFLRAHRAAYPYFFGFSAFFLISGIFFPPVLKRVHWAWMKVVSGINYVITTFILCFIFYLVLTPIGVMLRIFGRDLLDREFPGKKFVRISWKRLCLLRLLSELQASGY